MPLSSELALILAASALATTGMTSVQIPRAETYVVALTGDAEAPASAGDRDGSGEVTLTVDMDHQRICFDFEVSHLATPLMAHIHRARAPKNGPSVITLFTGPGAELHDCVIWTEKWLAEIVAEPSDFYVNLYTTEYPDGALRGQLAASG